MWPDFCHVNDIPTVRLSFAGVHNLEIDIPHGIIFSFDGLGHVLDIKIRVFACKSSFFLSSKILTPC